MKTKFLITLSLLFLIPFTSIAQCSVNLGPDKTSCAPTSYTLDAGHMDTVSYLWSPSGDTTQTISISTSRTYIVKITTKSNCQAMDTIKVTINPLPDLTTKALKPYCYNYGKVNLTADAAPTIKDIIFSSRISGLVEKVGNTWWFNTPILDGSIAHNIYITKEYTNPITLCYKKDSFLIKILDNPVVQVQDQTFCQDYGEVALSSSSARIVIFPTQAQINGGFRNWAILSKDGGVAPGGALRNDGTSFNAKWIFNPNYPDTSYLGDYEMAFSFENTSTGCTGYDTMTLSVVEVPVIAFTPIPEQCNHWDTLELDNYVNLKSGVWKVIEKDNQREHRAGDYSTYVIEENKFDPSIVGRNVFTTFYLRFEHTASGCPTKDSIQLIVNGRPDLESNITIDTQCNTTGFLSLKARVNGQVNSSIIWEGKNVIGRNFWINQIKFDSLESLKNLKVRYSYRDPFTTCENFDSINIVVQAKADIDIVLDTLRSAYNTLVPLKANSFSNNGILWTTTGDGTFNEKYNLNTEYNQGTTDKSKGGTILYATSIANGPCKEVKDSLLLEIFPLSTNNNELNTLKIYPSPTASNFSIELPQSFNNGTLRILGIDGKIVKEIDVVKNQSIFSTDISTIANGVYFIELLSQKDIYKGKIVKR